ncbi:hypothetical protein BH10BAC2_BH10BAC2_10750 [soil metagenome]
MPRKFAGHFVFIVAVIFFSLLNTELNVQECDATKTRYLFICQVHNLCYKTLHLTYL